MAVTLFSHNQKAYRNALKMLSEKGKAAIVHPTGSVVPANSKVPKNILLEYNVVYDGRFTEPIERRTPYGNNYKFEDGM